MDLSLPARAKELQARARAFCEEVLLPLELTVDEAGELPEAERPPLKLMSLHIWAMSHGVATLFSQGGRAARKVPMTPEEILESGMLIYLKGLGVLPDEKGGEGTR